MVTPQRKTTRPMDLFLAALEQNIKGFETRGRTVRSIQLRDVEALRIGIPGKTLTAFGVPIVRYNAVPFGVALLKLDDGSTHQFELPGYDTAGARPAREQLLLDLLEQDEGVSGIGPIQAVIIRDALADNDALRRQILALRDTIAKLSPVIEALWNAVVTQVMPVFRALEPYLNEDAPMGAEWDDLGRTEVPVRLENPPRTDGAALMEAFGGPAGAIRGICSVCGAGVHVIEWPTGSRCVHDDTLITGHDAVPGPGMSVRAVTEQRVTRGVCSVCEGAIHWINSPYGGWWAHEEHPADGHDAELRVAHGEAELP